MIASFDDTTLRGELSHALYEPQLKYLISENLMLVALSDLHSYNLFVRPKRFVGVEIVAALSPSDRKIETNAEEDDEEESDDDMDLPANTNRPKQQVESESSEDDE